MTALGWPKRRIPKPLWKVSQVQEKVETRENRSRITQHVEKVDISGMTVVSWRETGQPPWPMWSEVLFFNRWVNISSGQAANNQALHLFILTLSQMYGGPCVQITTKRKKNTKNNATNRRMETNKRRTKQQRLKNTMNNNRTSNQKHWLKTLSQRSQQQMTQIRRNTTKYKKRKHQYTLKQETWKIYKTSKAESAPNSGCSCPVSAEMSHSPRTV